MMGVEGGERGLVVLAMAVNLVLIVGMCTGGANANVVLNVQHKFGGRGGGGGGSGRSILSSLKAHDARRHGRMLGAIDFQLAGNGLITDVALYYTKLSIGTPPRDFRVQMDTGSNDLWLNCAGCDQCPKQTNLGFQMTSYDLKASSTGKSLSCKDESCQFINPENSRDSCKAGMQCVYDHGYGDGSHTAGYYVHDRFKFDQITGNLKTRSIYGSLFFGCSSKQTGNLNSSSTDIAVDGIVGFGQGNSSILSQLAASGKVRKIFSHCLDSVEGGGIFAIGEVVEPRVKTTPMVPGKPHYNAFLQKITVGGADAWTTRQLTAYTKVDKRGLPVIIDSGSTLAAIPGEIYDPLMAKLMLQQPSLELQTVSDFDCIEYTDNLDDGFPVVSFHFENSATLHAYPHDYFFQASEGLHCFGWQKRDFRRNPGELPVTLLGDVVLSDKLIVYDVENQTIGWTEYNCSSRIKVRDDESDEVYSVAAHDLVESGSAPAMGISSGKICALFVFLLTLCFDLI